MQTLVDLHAQNVTEFMLRLLQHYIDNGDMSEIFDTNKDDQFKTNLLRDVEDKKKDLKVSLHYL